jgi:hypothetical protein
MGESHESEDPRCQDNPGGKRAVATGCTCPIHENSAGAGYNAGDGSAPDPESFAVHDGCPLHGQNSDRRFDKRVRYAFGEWWVDEFTNDTLIHVCCRSHYYPMEMTRQFSGGWTWRDQVSRKAWFDGDMDALNKALAKGEELQAAIGKIG